MLGKKNKFPLKTDKQTDDAMPSDPSDEDIVLDETAGESNEVTSIQEFIEKKKLQNQILKKLIENMDKTENR